ncbi:hypothetical protein HDV00_012038 [Rhizophlyctis rosea]|nr:hypothetical protein HDV00_012038 [Rhizophlyctis rosea]
MPPKKVNSKAAAANERKAGQEAAKNAQKAAQKEAEEATKWSAGAKDTNKKAQEEAKRQELLAKKAEREAMLAAEEAELPTKKPSQKASGSAKKAAKKEDALAQFERESNANTPEYSASGLDAALDLMDIASGGTQGKSSDNIERHPEKRMKSAWAAFEERELPLLKAENPSLRQSQLKQMLQKKWKKSPENPMNQQAISYDTTRQDEREMIKGQREETLESMRTETRKTRRHIIHAQSNDPGPAFDGTRGVDNEDIINTPDTSFRDTQRFPDQDQFAPSAPNTEYNNNNPVNIPWINQAGQPNNVGTQKPPEAGFNNPTDAGPPQSPPEIDEEQRRKAYEAWLRAANGGSQRRRLRRRSRWVSQ